MLTQNGKILLLLKVKREIEESKANKVKLELKVIKEIREIKVILELKVFKVYKECKVFKESKV